MDQKTIREVKKGNREAQKKLYQHFYESVMRIAMRYSRDEEEASDLLQEIFIQVFKKINTVRENSIIEHWIHKIAKNKAIDQYRKSKKSREIAFSKLKPADQEEDNESFLADEIQVDEELEFSPEDVMKAIQSLSPQYRAVFNMYIMDDYGHKEIAEALNISEGTSKSNLHKAKKKVALILEKKNK